MKKILIEIGNKQYILVGDELQLFDNLLLKDLLSITEKQQLIQREKTYLVRCQKCGALIETAVHCDNCGTFEPTYQDGANAFCECIDSHFDIIESCSVCGKPPRH